MLRLSKSGSTIACGTHEIGRAQCMLSDLAQRHEEPNESCARCRLHSFSPALLLERTGDEIGLCTDGPGLSNDRLDPDTIVAMAPRSPYSLRQKNLPLVNQVQCSYERSTGVCDPTARFSISEIKRDRILETVVSLASRKFVAQAERRVCADDASIECSAPWP